jgi:hypothetical protein
MTTAVWKLLDSFDALSQDEKQDAAIALLRRLAELQRPELPKETLVSAADALKNALEEEQRADISTELNLDRGPTRRQLKRLLAKCDDTASAHVLWVRRDGEVEISRIATGRVDARTVRDEPCVRAFQQQHPEMQLRCETFLRGNQYVGPVAADSGAWVAELFGILLEEWAKAKGRPEVVYVPISDAERRK